MNTRDPHFAVGSDMADVQGSHDPRNIAIGLVGVKGVRYPLHWGSGTERQAAVGDFTMSVSLPADQKGTHMSRFIAMLEEHSASGTGRCWSGCRRGGVGWRCRSRCS
jgi:GTP cyclohydrolase I